LATRWSEDNAFCLCASCHLFFTHRPIEWEDYVISRIGEHGYRELRLRAVGLGKPDYGELLEQLEERLKELGIRESSQDTG
jgi:hypothetical protein